MIKRATIAIVGGTGFNVLSEARVVGEQVVATPFGATSAPLLQLDIGGNPVVFLPRHGNPHRIAPHRINYRANLWALRHSGVEQVLAINAVGGIAANAAVSSIVIPEQIIDYTHGREHTFFDGGQYAGVDSELDHVNFTWPYSKALRQSLVIAAAREHIDIVNSGVYGATQGPRLESAAEIRRLAQDGCSVVGMTGMPEAGLARELALEYAAICLVVNTAAGLGKTEITMAAIDQVLATGMSTVRRLLTATIRELAIAGQKSSSASS